MSEGIIEDIMKYNSYKNIYKFYNSLYISGLCIFLGCISPTVLIINYKTSGLPYWLTAWMAFTVGLSFFTWGRAAQMTKYKDKREYANFRMKFKNNFKKRVDRLKDI